MLVRAKEPFLWYPNGISIEEVPAGTVCELPDWLGRYLIETGKAAELPVEDRADTGSSKRAVRKRGRRKDASDGS